MAIPNQTQAPVERVTSAGTDYWEYYVTPPASGDRARVMIPKSLVEGQKTRAALILHGRTMDEASIHLNPRTGMRDALLNAGVILLSPYMHGDSWGNRQAQDDIGALHDWAAALWEITGLLSVGESMSGNTAAIIIKLKELPIVGTVMLSPSLDLQDVWNRGAEGHHGLETAFNVPADGTGFSEATAEWDAMRQPASDFTDAPLLTFASPDDTAIGYSTNVVPFMDRVATVSEDATLVTVTGGHTSADTYRPAEIMAFFDRLSPAPENPPEEETPPEGQFMKVWDGSVWAHTKNVKVWDGSGWVHVRSVRVWTGTTWASP